MRLWSLHPRYLDRRGLVALWREGLLAQAVLRGRTRGYRHHPQLDRFRAQSSPVGGIADYLRAVLGEASARGYDFTAGKLSRLRLQGTITVTRGQLEHEWAHLMEKVKARDTAWHRRIGHVVRPDAHPMLRVIPGDVETWERGRVNCAGVEDP
jgi:hypothetical protein